MNLISTLPNPLEKTDGAMIVSAQEWEQHRRPEILEDFREHVYGRVPDSGNDPVRLTAETIESGIAFEGRAERRQVILNLTRGKRTVALDLLIYIPTQSKGPVPAFLILNFDGNHTVGLDSAVVKTGPYTPEDEARPCGWRAHRHPVEKVIKRGYAYVTLSRHAIDPDYDDGFLNGVHALFDEPKGAERSGDAWGTVAAWSWGLSRVLDYLETEPAIDAQRVTVAGHSRNGKAALWAGAQDERFAAVISNNSGNTGASLSRRDFGESVSLINQQFPHWFARNYHAYGNRVEKLPLDQHFLLALIAPRPLYVASASEDDWADPVGEFYALEASTSVYRLYDPDLSTLGEPPGAGESCSQGPLKYHLRPGPHDMLVFDWERFLDFADKWVIGLAAEG